MRADLFGLTVFVVLFGFEAFASPRTERMTAWLLTSVPEKDADRSRSFDFLRGGLSHEEKLASTFRKFLGSFDFEIQARHQATQRDLWEALRDPSAAVIIWVAHANPGTVSAPGLSSQVLVDYRRRNAAPLLRATGPNLRYLGIAGCGFLPALEKMAKEPEFRRRSPLLKVSGFPSLVDGEVGLRQLAAEAYLYLLYRQRQDPGVLLSAPVSDSVRVKLRLKSRAVRDFEFRLRIGRNLLAVVSDRDFAGDDEIELAVPGALMGRPIQVETGDLLVPSTPVIPEFELIDQDRRPLYRLETDPAGRPLGISSQVLMPAN